MKTAASYRLGTPSIFSRLRGASATSRRFSFTNLEELIFVPARGKAARGRPQTSNGGLFEEHVRLGQSLVDLIPVHHVPPRFEVVRTPVLILQIVGMLPDIIS